MIALINKITHTKMWVADERLNDYLEAGHVLASSISDAKPDEVADQEPKPAKKATKKAPAKKKK